MENNLLALTLKPNNKSKNRETASVSYYKCIAKDTAKPKKRQPIGSNSVFVNHKSTQDTNIKKEQETRSIKHQKKNPIRKYIKNLTRHSPKAE